MWVFMSVSRKASISGWKILPNRGLLLLRDAHYNPLEMFERIDLVADCEVPA